ncbi:MAG: DUF799 family lipoprotein [Nitrospiraceae bacterium]
MRSLHLVRETIAPLAVTTARTLTRKPVGLCHVLVGLALTGCLGLPVQTVTPNPSNPLRQIAVLQLVNNTNDVDAPGYVRKYISDAMVQHAYVVKPLPDTDLMLKDQMGISLGKQFDMVTAQQLGETLGVDGVLYGSLEDFSHSLTEKRIRLRAKLVNCKTGETVWSNGLGIIKSSGGVGGRALGAMFDDSSQELPPLFGTPIQAGWIERHDRSTSNDLIGGMAVGLTEKLVMGAFSVPLYVETNEAIGGLLRSIPAGPGQAPVVVDPNDTSNLSVPAPGITVVTPK